MTFAPLSEADARAIASWAYPPPYDVYNMPGWPQAVAQGWAIADPVRRPQQFSAIVSGGALVGYFRVQRQADTALLGLGLRPDQCGRGRGAAVVNAILDHLRTAYPDLAEAALEVRRFNQRAIRCYRRCGFVPCGAPYTREVLGSAVDFVRMVCPLRG